MVQSYLRDIEDEIPEITYRKLIVFRLHGEEFGVNIAEVKEVMKKRDITLIPNVKEYIAGIMNMKGSLCVLVDLSKVFRYPDTEDSGDMIMIFEIDEGHLAGVIVDSVEGTLDIDQDKINPTPPMIAEKINSRYMEGVCVIEDRVVIVIDILKMLKELEVGKDIQALSKTPLLTAPEKEKVPEARQEVPIRTKKPSGIMAFQPKNPFWLDGQEIKDLTELTNSLKVISDDVFNRHVGPDHNDFANWIEHEFDHVGVFPAVIRTAHTKKELIHILGKGGV